MKKVKLNFIIIAMLAVTSIFTSCHDKIYIDNDNEVVDDTNNDELSGSGEDKGDVLVVNVTLDNMGGRAYEGSTNDPLAKMENYIDLEKFRVLVFGKDDKFLFESKSRWVKQLNPAADHSEWSVSIPLYSYGNDRAYDWDWEYIRDQITTYRFKIAILTNRPEVICFSDYADNTVNGQRWFNNSGPNWTADDTGVKTVFDLHHAQWDPIYESKGGTANDAYDFIMGKDEKGRPALGSTSSWVQYGTNDEKAAEGGTGINRDPNGWDFRKNRLPSEDYPIPMYGIQEYEPLTGWKKGTTVDLNREFGMDGNEYRDDKPVSLLRSVVKLEIILPFNFEPDDVTMWYPNIFARCEPMDVWTPTDEIWRNEHPIDGSWDNDNCEMKIIKEHGLITTYAGEEGSNNNYNYADADISDEKINANKLLYQQRMCWIYGAWWQDDKWSFGKTIDDYMKEKYSKDTERFPHIFNPCIQRNNTIYVEETYRDVEGIHYVAYVGERNINDPSYLYKIASNGSGHPTILYWCVIKDGKTYSFPIVDYANAVAVGNVTRIGTATGKPTNGTNTALNTGMGEYLLGVFGNNGSQLGSQYWPLPLLRNHIYKLTLTSSSSAKTRTGESDMNFSVHFEEMHTKDIGFK